MLRTDETDAMIDLCIGLEALLGDESSSEMTHKLAMRVAALHSLVKSEGPEPLDVFRTVKKLYTYRSKLVHGRSDAAKHRLIGDEESERTLEAGIRLLRRCLKVLIEHPEFQDAKEVDAGLLRAGLAT
jgi:hypothetical protein